LWVQRAMLRLLLFKQRAVVLIAEAGGVCAGGVCVHIHRSHGLCVRSITVPPPPPTLPPLVTDPPFPPLLAPSLTGPTMPPLSPNSLSLSLHPPGPGSAPRPPPPPPSTPPPRALRIKASSSREAMMRSVSARNSGKFSARIIHLLHKVTIYLCQKFWKVSAPIIHLLNKVTK
jgi:hypothetical protein